MFGFRKQSRGPSARELVADGARLLDVRGPDEFADGHLPGAIHIPVDELQTRICELEPRDAGVVVYCRSGRRSAKAAELLRTSGFAAVYDLGSMSDWR
jgi:phage shock protein E